MSNNLKNIIQNDYCVGCGACSYLSNVDMKINAYGEYLPSIEILETDDELLKKVCPFLSPELNETILAKKLFEKTNLYDETLGYYLDTYAGYIKEDDYREDGTSGGTTTWIVTELLRKKLIDGVIHVKENQRENINDPFYKYGLSFTEEEIKSASKTRYHVVEMSEILTLISNTDKNFAFIGVPCMCKTIRRLQLIDNKFKDRIPFVISLVCGHLKSINWSLSLSWGAGIEPKNSSRIQYRTKDDNIPARAYVFKVDDNKKNTIQKDSALVAGGKYNAGALMLKACEYCDDVIGETSDLTIGDAWLPKFEADDNGTNLLVVRNNIILDILKKAHKEERLELIHITPKEAISSQSGGYKQRREGLAYRLQREIAIGNWVPEKRIKPNQFTISKRRKEIYNDRSYITEVSRLLFKKALEENNYNFYDKKISKLTAKLRKKEIINSLPKLLLNKAQRVILKLLKRK